MKEVIIVGLHSIAEALRNKKRSLASLYASEDGLDELKKKHGVTKAELERVEIKLCSSHKIQEEAKRYYSIHDFNYTRVPSQIFLIAESLEEENIGWVSDMVNGGKAPRIICLDQVTDVQNAAAIMRTACFYGVDAILISAKGNFGIAPSFARIASGALEHVKIIKVASLPKAITKLKSLGYSCIGFSEHETQAAEKIDSEKIALVLGAEDVGLSNAVMRMLDKTVAFKSQGPIKSLNVSVAAAVAMEKFFSGN